MNSTPEIRKAAALAAIAAGYAVLPVTGGQKGATGNKKLGLKSGEGGVHNASKESSVVEGWFRRWPKSNYGIACGSKSGLWVLDIDDQELADRELPWNTVDLTEKTFSVRTPHGWHIYFRLPEGAALRSYNKKKLCGIEIKADGTYVLGPLCIANSSDSGWGEYVPWNELEPMEAPPLVWEWVVEHTPVRRAERAVGEDEDRELDPAGNCFDDFNLNADFPLYLESKGWKLVDGDTGGGGVTHWCRPGKQSGVSATLGWRSVGSGGGFPLFHVFTSSVDELEQDRSYTPAGVFIALEGEGGGSLVAQRKLRQMGFGISVEKLQCAYSLLANRGAGAGDLVQRARSGLVPVPSVLEQYVSEQQNRSRFGDLNLKKKVGGGCGG